MKIALGIEYDGSDFHGWQTQRSLNTVQGCLDAALSSIANEEIITHCAGRTDTGVHALGQVVHFETDAVRPLRAFTAGTNTLLPRTISVHWAKAMEGAFHARFSALARRYNYLIYNHKTHSALFSKRATWINRPLDINRMQVASEHLIGEHDFSSFRGAHCESKTPMRNVHEINIHRQGLFIVIEVQANAFLHHMVRNIVGSLIRIGLGFESTDWLLKVLKQKDRKAAAETAPPQGLYLSRVIYPESDEVIQPDSKILLF